MNDELTLNGTYINIAYHNSRVSELEKQLAEYDKIAAEYGIDGKTMLTLAKSQIETAKENIVLREALEESQRREKAAVECVEEVEYSLASSHFSAAWAAIREWRGIQENGE